jgi:hypothetical protein
MVYSYLLKNGRLSLPACTYPVNDIPPIPTGVKANSIAMTRLVGGVMVSSYEQYEIIRHLERYYDKN